MATLPLLKIDASNRDAHSYLDEEDECFFFYEYTARQGFNHSEGNNLVHNLKKSVLLRGQNQYQYKVRAINSFAATLRAAFARSAWVITSATVVPVPPSKARSHPEYDDRMIQVASLACAGRGPEMRELVRQTQSYEASHMQADGQRKRPNELEAMYALHGNAPKDTVILIDDVLTTGAHFVAIRNVIRAIYPDTRVVGFFLARRVPSSPFAALDIV